LKIENNIIENMDIHPQPSQMDVGICGRKMIFSRIEVKITRSGLFPL
jgi:hypothetical protein